MNIQSTLPTKLANHRRAPNTENNLAQEPQATVSDRFEFSSELALTALAGVSAGALSGYVGSNMGLLGTAVGGLTGAAVLGSVGVGLGWRAGAFITGQTSGNEEPGGFAGMALGGVGGVVAGALLGANSGSFPAALAGAALGATGAYFLSEFG